jgi:hypothetical protein
MCIMRPKALTVFIFIGLILLGLCSCGKDKELLDEIYNDPGYTIGKITSSSTVVMVLLLRVSDRKYYSQRE